MSNSLVPIITKIRSVDGVSTAKISHLGANITSWKVNGKEKLFFSKNADLTKPGIEIYGGIPIVFPQFAKWEMNPNPPRIPDPSPDQSIQRPAHGFARLATWELVSVDVNIATFKLKNSDFTKQFWSHEFELIYSITLTNSSINCEIIVENTDSTDFEFTCLFHNYMRCSDIKNTWLFGLQHTMFWDAINRNTRVFDKVGDKIYGVTQTEGIDNVYEDSKNAFDFHPNGDKTEVLKLQKSSNLTNTVVWNPGPDNAQVMKHFGSHEYVNMLCVEFGRVVDPKLLNPGEKFTFSQKISVK